MYVIKQINYYRMMAYQLLMIIIGKKKRKEKRLKKISFRNYRTGTVLIQCQWHHKFEQTYDKSSQFYRTVPFVASARTCHRGFRE